MEKIIIENLLISTYLEMETNDNQELRAKKVLGILEIECQKNSSVDLLSSTQAGLVEMINEMKKIEMLHEIEYSKNLIHYFIETGKFDLITLPINKNNIETVEKFNKIKNLIIKIINIQPLN